MMRGTIASTRIVADLAPVIVPDVNRDHADSMRIEFASRFSGSSRPSDHAS